MSEDRLLILAVDIDNDLFQKTGINGPVIGRDDVLNAATKLVLADPLDTDGNTLFEAVKKYDELKSRDYEVYIAEITGSVTENFLADEELSRQLDDILNDLKVDACVLVTDGASDNRVIPIIKTRLKINSVDFVQMKQAVGFENTYFTVLEKLKEPHYARIVFGIPALLILLFSISFYLHLGVMLPFILIGIYLLLKGSGLEDILVSSFEGLGMSIRRVSFIFYMASILFMLSSIVVGYSNYLSSLGSGNGILVSYGYSVDGMVMLVSVSLVMYVIGRMIDLSNLHMYYRVINQGIYIGYAIISLALLYIFSDWIIGGIYFYQLILYSIIAFVLGYIVTLVTMSLKKHSLMSVNIKDKIVLNDIGAYIGKVSSINLNKGRLLVKTSYGTTLSFTVDRIVSISDRVIIR